MTAARDERNARYIKGLRRLRPRAVLSRASALR